MNESPLNESFSFLESTILDQRSSVRKDLVRSEYEDEIIKQTTNQNARHVSRVSSHIPVRPYKAERGQKCPEGEIV